MTQLVVVLPQFGDQLCSLQLDLGVGGQVIGGGSLSDHGIRLDVQIPVDPETTSTPKRSVNPCGGVESRQECVLSTHTAGL